MTPWQTLVLLVLALLITLAVVGDHPRPGRDPAPEGGPPWLG